MKKFINSPDNFVTETIDGILAAHHQLRALDDDKRVIIRNVPPVPGKVSVVTAGGSGHLPVFLGYVGDGLLDACTVGNTFASPSAHKMFEMIRAADQGSGVLCLYGNYSGDKLNFQMACDMADMSGIKTQQVRVCDDVASASNENIQARRGVAGMVYAFKIAGAAANDMLPLEEVSSVTAAALDNIRSMGAALSPCIVPEVGIPTFTIKEDEIEIGMGIHGEPGIHTQNMMSADEVADILLEHTMTELSLSSGDEVSVMVNSLGATPLEELYIIYRRVQQRLAAKNISIFMPHIGNFAASMEMSGCSLTLFKLTGLFKKYLSSPACTPFYTSLNK